MKQAVAVLIPTSHGYVAVSRPNAPTLWSLPGGKVDPGETLIGAIIRETEEEISLTLDPKDLRHVYTGPCYGEVDYMTTTYVATANVAHLVPETGLQVGFADREQLTDPSTCPFAEYIREMFRRLDAIPVVK